LSLDEPRLVASARAAAAGAARTIVSIETMGLPEWDHPVAEHATTPSLDEDDRGNYLKTLVLRVD
jgi:hypothetical protein